MTLEDRHIIFGLVILDQYYIIFQILTPRWSQAI